MFGHLFSVNCTAIYIASHEKIEATLNDDDDVQNMIILHICMKLSIIQLKAVRKFEPSRGNRNFNW